MGLRPRALARALVHRALPRKYAPWLKALAGSAIEAPTWAGLGLGLG